MEAEVYFFLISDFLKGLSYSAQQRSAKKRQTSVREKAHLPGVLWAAAAPKRRLPTSASSVHCRTAKTLPTKTIHQVLFIHPTLVVFTKYSHLSTELLLRITKCVPLQESFCDTLEYLR